MDDKPATEVTAAHVLTVTKGAGFPADQRTGWQGIMQLQRSGSEIKISALSGRARARDPIKDLLIIYSSSLLRIQ